MLAEVLNWPLCPEHFDCQGIALILLDLPKAASRADARMHARAVARKAACRLLQNSELIETPKGPKLAQSHVHLSLSYAKGKALVGFSCGRPLGVDIVRIEHMPEVDALTSLYLPVAEDFDDAGFALAWARLEACCKALDLPLAEIDEHRKKAYASCELPECLPIDGYRMAAALAP